MQEGGDIKALFIILADF